MKKWAVAGALAVVACVAVALVNAQAEPKPEKGMVIGEVVELTAYAMKGPDAEDYLETAKDRAEHGFQLAIIEEDTGKLWFPAYRHSAPASHLKLPNPYLMELVGKKAVLQGIKYETKKINVIRFSVASEY